MAERLVQETHGGVQVLKPHGYVNAAIGSAIAAACTQLLSTGCRTMVIDLSEADDVNSMGISALFEVLTAARNAGALLAFAGLSAALARTFEVMGVTELAPLHRSLAEALEGVAAGGSPSRE